MKIILTIAAIVTILFFPVFRGNVPFPGSYLTAWYEPWRTATKTASSLGVVHKPVADDVFRQIYPFKNLASEMFRGGLWPLWNPYNGAGQPLLATMHPGFLNPFSFVMLFIPGIWGWVLYVMIQPILLGIGTYIYLRSIKIGSCGSLYGTIVMMLSGFAVTRYIYGDYVFALSALPLLLFFIEQWLQTEDVRFLFGVPPVIAFLFFCVQPQIAVYVILCTAFYAVIRVIKERKNEVIRIGAMVGSIIFGGLLASIQLFLTFDLYRQSNMTTDASGFIMQRFLLPITHLVTLGVPNYFGNIGTYNWWGSGDYVETILSIGTIPLFFALYACLKRFKVDFRIRFFALMTACTLLLSFDSPITRYLYHLPIPLLSTAIPSRIYMITTFSIVVLSAFGVDYLEKSKWKIPLFYSVLFGAAFVAIIIYSFVVIQQGAICPIQVPNCRMVALRNTLLETGVYISFILLVILFSSMRRRKIIPFVLYSIIVVIGWYNSTKFIPFSPVSTIYPKNPLIEKLREQAGTYRVLGLGNAALSTDLATEVRLFDPQYYEPLYNRRYGELVGYAKSKEGEVMKLSRSDVEVDTTIFKENPANPKIQKLYDLLGIGYFFYKKSDVDDSHVFPEIIDWPNDFWTIKANATVLPRVYVVHSIETITEDRIILDRLFDDSFNIRTSAILEKEPSEVIRGTPLDDAAHIDIYKPNDVTISVYTKDTGLLVLTDNYDPGWHAFIDGEETDIYRTNYTFRGVIVPYGEHVIRFIYMPQTFILGKAVTIVGFSLLVAAVGLFSLHRFRHRRLI